MGGDPATPRVLMAYVAAFCLAATSIHGDMEGAGVCLAPLLGMSLRSEEAMILEGVLSLPEARLEELGKTLSLETSDSLMLQRVWGSVYERALARVREGVGSTMQLLLALLHRRYGHANIILKSRATPSGGSRLQQPPPSSLPHSLRVLEEQSAAIFSSQSLPHVQLNPLSLNGGTSSNDVTAFERNHIWGAMASGTLGASSAGGGLGGGFGGGGDVSMADASLATSRLLPFSAPPTASLSDATKPLSAVTIIPSSVKRDLDASADWSLGSASTHAGTPHSVNLSRLSTASSAVPLTPFTPSRLLQQDHAMGAPSPYVPAWMARQEPFRTSLGPSPAQRATPNRSFTPSKKPPLTPFSAAPSAGSS
eukprot:CAMPEP_0173459896 /NCGR_PEP_ID=MMETSP1357-20121228/62202_1 /TAXON_ID=77926 /ORGANISM="Hemiselmis rufescens, Strain PCC563" /LENGTH=365 /DNA_ID=CAMNT_0014427403 /DNA_START=316 /DNA_END=1410 /DNA_ORIENTATION=+